MKTKDLLTYLDNIETLLGDFSYEELDTTGASQLKKSFEAFKQDLEDKIFGGATVHTSGKTNKTLPQGVEETPNPSPNMLIAKVSHEIRTPLNGIIGFTDLLKEDGLPDHQLEKVNAIQSASYSLLEIINELLEYSKLASGIEEFERIDFNFRNVIKEVAYLCNTLIMDKSIALEVNVDPKIPEVLVGDPSKLSQILLNLLGNSIKFVETGKIRLDINALRNSSHRPLQLQFSISDTGIGIAQDKLATIFNPFEQANTDTSLRYGGSGLGLHIVKQIIDNLKGEISVASTLGSGTTFNFVLPYTIGDLRKTNPSDSGPSTHKKEEASLKGMRILVFEDNLLNQRLIEQRLTAWGCKTFITENAQYGLQLLETHKIDLVLMDLRMPGMDGFEATSNIRKSDHQYIREIPVIALSADFSLKDREACEQLGIQDFILKPYSPDELFSKLVELKNSKKMIGDQEQQQALAKSNGSPINGPIDLSSVLKDCMGEMELLEELVQLYKNNVLEFIGAAKSYISLGDFEQLAFSAHKIKAGLAMMQSHDLLDIVNQLKKACEVGGDLKHLQFLYTCFLEEYPKTERRIDEAMTKIKEEGR